MKKKTRNSLIIIVVLVVILGLGFGIWKIFFAPKPLKIKDLERIHITTVRSPIASGWYLEIRAVSGQFSFGEILDSKNVFNNAAAKAVLTPIKCWVFIDGAAGIDIQAGDTLEITYDDGQELKIYFPRIVEDVNLFVATDGSTYYNRWLTRVAQSAPEPGEVEERE